MNTQELRPSLRVRALWLALLVLGPGLALWMLPARTQAAPTTFNQRYAVLIVCNGSSKAQRLKEDRIVLLIRRSMAEQDLPREMLPILVYHMDKPSEAQYCKTKLGIGKQHLVFLGLAEHDRLVVKKVILRENNVNNPEAAVQQLFMKAFKLVTGMDLPTTMPPSSTPTRPNVTPGTGGVRVLQPQTCQSVKRPGGEPVGATDAFGRSDTVYVSFVTAGLQVGTFLEVKWYRDDVLVHTSSLTSPKTGDCYVWFRLDPKPVWAAGRYRAEIFGDGRYKTTLYYRINSGR